MLTAALSDAEIAAICAPLVQGAAQVRYYPCGHTPSKKPLAYL